jgi:sugar phosphate isomerase/epimerase
MITRDNPLDPSGGPALGSRDLVLAAATLSPGGDTPLAVAADAAVAGGFGGLSLWASTYVAELARGSSPAELRQSVIDAGLVVDHVEAVIGWVGPGDPGAPYAEEATRTQVFQAGVALGVSVDSVLLFGPRGTSEDAAAEVFSGIAVEAAKHGLRAALSSHRAPPCETWPPRHG